MYISGHDKQRVVSPVFPYQLKYEYLHKTCVLYVRINIECINPYM